DGHLAARLILLVTPSGQILMSDYEGFQMRFRRVLQWHDWAGPWRDACEVRSWPGGSVLTAERGGAYMLFVDERERYRRLPLELTDLKQSPCVGMVCEFDDADERERY